MEESNEENSGFFASVLNWFHSISKVLELVKNSITQVLNYLNPLDENFLGRKLIELLSDLLEYLFIPQNNVFNSIQETINTKFSFVSQIQDLFSGLLNDFVYGDDIPTFNINYYGKTLNIIDFSIFLNYRVWLHNIILGIAWFIYIRKLFNKIPNLIGGV